MGPLPSLRSIVFEQDVSFVCLLAYRRHDDKHATLLLVAYR